MIKVSDFFDELKLRRDSHVADFGCGVGENSKLLSELVPDGKVFAIELNSDLLEFLNVDIKRGEKENIYQNIVPVWANIEELDGTRLRDDSIDAILISNSFYLLKHKKTCAIEMKRVLKRYGKILFIDWHSPLGKSVLHKESVLEEEKVIQMFQELDMKVYPRVYRDEYHFVLVVEK